MDLGALSALSKVHLFLQTVEHPHPHTQLQLLQVTLHLLQPVTLPLLVTQPLPQATLKPLTQNQVMGTKLKNRTIVQSRFSIFYQILKSVLNEKKE